MHDDESIPVKKNTDTNSDIDPALLRIPNKKTLFNAGELMRALAAPIRIAIVLLLDEPRCVHQIVETLGITQPLVSQHLRVLRSAGVVTGERTGKEVLYQLADNHLAQIVHAAIEHVQE